MDESQGASLHPSSASAPAAEIARGGTVKPIGISRGASSAAEQLHAPQEMTQRPIHEAAIVRYELRDPRLDVTYRAKTYREITDQAEHLGASRLTAIHADGMRTPIRKVDGEWQHGDSLPPLRKPPPDVLTTRDDVVDLSAGLEASLAATPAAGRTAKQGPRVDKAHAKALAKIDAQAERAAMVARIESSLSERYIIKRAPLTLGDMAIGSTEYRFRGDSSRVAFTESNLRLSTDTNSPSVARSMVDLAQARGWNGLRVSGSEDFRRMVWLEATIRGVKALGYEPTPADLSILKRERAARQVNRIEPAPEANVTGAAPAGEKPSTRGGGRKAVVAAIDAVLIAKKVPEAKRLAVLAAAQEQLAQMARNGHVPKIKVYDRSAERQLTVNPPVHEQNRQQDRAAPTHVR